MDELFKDLSTRVQIYRSKETIEDPLEKNKTEVYLPPLPISAIVSDLNFSSLQYKIPGLMVEKGKELIINKKYKNLVELSTKIGIDGEFYCGYKVSGKLQYKTEGNYIRIICYIQKLK